MARQLTDEQITIAKAWLHDLFVYGGMISTPKRPIEAANYGCMYGGDHWKKSRYQQDAVTLCKAIKIRQVETKAFLEYNQALEHIAECYFNPDLKSTEKRNVTRKKPDMLARYIAWFCATNQFYWNNTNTSTYEMDEIRKTTLGEALWDMSCFTSQPDPSTIARTRTPRTTVAADGTTVTAEPKNDFKSRGPLSGKAVDLISQPGQKEFLSGKIFCILGCDTTGKPLEDCVYIRPVEDKQAAKYMVGNTNKVLFGSAKGYGFCPCYFATMEDANAFLTKIDSRNFKLNPKVASITVFQKNAQSNGYFKIGTEFGPTYISAAKLNEDVQAETLTEEAPSISVDFNTYEEAFIK